MAELIDQPMADTTEADAHLPLSEDEQRVLALYDRLKELQLEISLIKAQKRYQEDAYSSPTDEETRKAQNDLLEARAKYVLRNDVIEAVMSANPVLKAVHNGSDASPVERDLLPYVERRDETAKSAAKSAAASGRLWDELTKVQTETLRTSRRNVELTAELLTLAEDARQKKLGRDDDPRLRRDLDKFEGEAKASKQRWRVVKGVASGVVAGSGVDWARDEALLDIVLDPEDEE